MAQDLLVGLTILQWHTERRHLINAFAVYAQRLATGGHHAGHCADAQQCLCHARGRVDHVLAVVQYQQQLLRPYHCGHPLDGMRTGGERQSQCARNGRGDQRRIRQRRQLGQPYAIGELGQQLARGFYAEPRLADAPGTGQRYEPAARSKIQHLFQFRFPADHIRRRHRQIRPRRREFGGERRGVDPVRTGSVFNCVRSDLGDEAVTPSGDGLEKIAILTERLAQSRDLNRKIDVFDHDPRPDTVQEFVFGDKLSALLDQHEKDIESAVAETDRHAIHQQLAAVGMHLESPELHESASLAGHLHGRNLRLPLEDKNIPESDFHSLPRPQCSRAGIPCNGKITATLARLLVAFKNN